MSKSLRVCVCICVCVRMLEKCRDERSEEVLLVGVLHCSVLRLWSLGRPAFFCSMFCSFGSSVNLSKVFERKQMLFVVLSVCVCVVVQDRYDTYVYVFS